MRLVGDGKAHYSDFAFIRDKGERWHCIGTYGKAGHEAGSGHTPSDGHALFHAVGDSLDKPMTLQDKVPYRIASPPAHMWSPAAIWNRDRTPACLYYFHYLGSSDFQENCVRLLTSASPDVAVWQPDEGTELPERNLVFRERDDRDFCVFWDDRSGVYLMYDAATYRCSESGTKRSAPARDD